jgi:hypothetical protein
MRNNNLSLLSGRVKKVASTNADANRYSYLDLNNAEPDAGVPSAHSSSRGLFGSDINGTRQWFYADAGLSVDTSTGQITVNEDTVAIDTSAFTNSTSDNLADVLSDFDQSLQSLGNNSLTTVSTDDTIIGAGTSGSPLSVGQKLFHDSKPEFAGLAITPDSIDISGLSLANPLVITTTGSHGLTDGELVTIENISGTTELNGNNYYVDVLSASTIALYSDQGLSTSINGTTGFSAYTSSGRVLSGGYRLPESDGTDGTYLKTNGFGLLEFDRPSAYQGSAPANPDTGDLWYDTANALDLLIYTGSAWVSTTTGGAQAAFVLRQFVGDGSTTVFQTNSPGVQKVLVFLNGILLRLTDDFTLNSSTGAITFLATPGSNDTIEVILTGDADLVGLELLGIENHDLITVDSSGNVTLQGELDMASNKIVNVTDPTSAQDAATKAYVDSVVTAADLDIAGDSGTGAVDLDSQTFTISGTANEIETAASGQTVTLGLPSTITVDVTGNLTGNVTGTVSSIANHNTDDLTEGSTNLYYTNARADARIAAASITDLSDADQTVRTTDNVTFGNITTTGYIAGPATLTIDPAGVGDNTGKVVIAGNLQIDGTTTTINSTVVSVDDLNLTLASGAANASAANGAGITIDGASATFTYVSASDRWTMNKDLATDLVGNVTGNVSGSAGTVTSLSNRSVGDLSDVDITTTAPTNNQALVWDNANGKFIPGDSFSQSDFDTAFTSKDTDDLSEGTTNLYYTNARADARISAASIDDLTDVDITTAAPTNNQVLVWDNANSKFIPGDAAADFTDLTGKIAASQIPNSIITSAMLDPTNVFSQEFTANGSTSAFTLSTDPGSKNAIQVFIDGVPQRASNYTVVGTTLTLGGTPVNGQVVEVRGYGIGIAVGTVADDSITGPKLQDGTITADKISSAAYASQTFTGDNSTTAFTLNNDPGTAQALLVMVENVIQEPIENYTTSGTTLTFTGVPALNARIYVRYLGLPLNNTTPPNDSVTNAKLNLTYTSNQYTGDNTTTAYTIASGHTINSVLVVLDGSILPPADYSVSGTTLTFGSAPLTSQSIDIRYMPV